MIGTKGLALIKRFEGFSALEYTCVAGKRTIGYGHCLSPDENYPAGVTEEQAEELLRDDVADAEDAVIRLVEVPLTPNQFDALVSFVFNVGSENFRRSTLLRRLNDGDYDGVAKEFGKWIYANEKPVAGLMQRRKAEAELFETEN